MNLQINRSEIPGCYELIPRIMKDDRGLFIKTFHEDFFAANDLNTHWAEEYFSISHKGVLRGLHFQTPPCDHVKLVYCSSGQVMDVILDLRLGSPTFCQHLIFDLSEEKANMIYIPRGCAHGFYTCSESATMMYKVSSVYAPENDAGILWNSAGVAWPDAKPLVSLRDAAFPDLDSFVSPFSFKTEGA